jgi:hypothetical protein
MLTHAAATSPSPTTSAWTPPTTPSTSRPEYATTAATATPSCASAPTPGPGTAQQDYDRLTAALDGRETTLVPGHRVSARYAPLDASNHQLFADPYETDAVVLLAGAVAGVSA